MGKWGWRWWRPVIGLAEDGEQRRKSGGGEKRGGDGGRGRREAG